MKYFNKTKKLVYICFGFLLSVSLCNAEAENIEEDMKAQFDKLMIELNCRNERAIKANLNLLMSAIAYEKSDNLIKSLINSTSVKEVSFEGDSALGWAAIYCSEEIIIEMLKVGAEINLQNFKGNTALFDVIRKTNELNIDIKTLRIKFLLSKRGDIGIANNNNQTAVDFFKKRYDDFLKQIDDFKFKVEAGYFSDHENLLNTVCIQNTEKAEKMKNLLDFLKIELHLNKKLRINQINEILSQRMSAPLIRLIEGYVFPEPKGAS